ncbi:DASH complex subunit Hsk3 like-domain-containing protein [Aspergillus leporis]|uniref:DASH complex subunit Hsk3 like-domain-containing protein n=1 Tax=Aspergillus leporis TaxID=41062 RepID=A0A5N5X8M3_9EURO|nr:DASH complex subunit Hsk3 like-domain-containing protein [Aspergillus leporis]
MPPSHHYTNSQSLARHSILPPSSAAATSSTGPSSMPAAKSRQYANLQAQLEQLNANLADTQNLLRMTSVQAEDMRFLGGYVGALFMGSAKVLGEEGVKGNADEKKSES